MGKAWKLKFLKHQEKTIETSYLLSVKLEESRKNILTRYYNIIRVSELQVGRKLRIALAASKLKLESEILSKEFSFCGRHSSSCAVERN